MSELDNWPQEDGHALPSVAVARREDMSPEGYLRLTVQLDGDVIVTVRGLKRGYEREYQTVSVEFCTGSGGGKSTPILSKLADLFRCIEELNRSSPGFDAGRRGGQS